MGGRERSKTTALYDTSYNVTFKILVVYLFYLKPPKRCVLFYVYSGDKYNTHTRLPREIYERDCLMMIIELLHLILQPLSNGAGFENCPQPYILVVYRISLDTSPAKSNQVRGWFREWIFSH